MNLMRVLIIAKYYLQRTLVDTLVDTHAPRSRLQRSLRLYSLALISLCSPPCHHTTPPHIIQNTHSHSLSHSNSHFLSNPNTFFIPIHPRPRPRGRAGPPSRSLRHLLLTLLLHTLLQHHRHLLIAHTNKPYSPKIRIQFLIQS